MSLRAPQHDHWHPGKPSVLIAPPPRRQEHERRRRAAAVMAVFTLPRPGQAAAAAAAVLAPGQPPRRESTLHPFAPNLTGRAAKDLPTDKLEGPGRFRSKSGRRHSRGALARARRKGHGVREQPPVESVYAVVDRGGTREVKTILKGLNAPNGIGLPAGERCLSRSATRSRLRRHRRQLDNPGEGKVVVEGLDPSQQPGHFLEVPRDGRTGSSTSTSAPREHRHAELHASLGYARGSRQGRARERRPGVRNSVGSTGIPGPRSCGSPTTGATGWRRSRPNDTLHRVTSKGAHFGYPSAIRATRSTPTTGRTVVLEFAPPALKARRAHRAPGMKFYTGRMFPPNTRNNIFIPCTARGTAAPSRAIT